MKHVRMIALLLAAAMVLSLLAACSGTKPETTTTEATTEATTTEATTTEATTTEATTTEATTTEATTAELTEEEKLAAYIETAKAELAKKVNVISVEAQEKTVVATISVDGAADMVAKTKAGDAMGKLKWDGLRGDLLVGSTQYYSALVGDFGLPDYSFRVDVVSEEDNSTLLYSAEQGEELFDAATAEPTEEEKLAAYIETATAELAKKVNVVSVEAQDKTVVATISVDGAADMVAKTRAGDGMGKLKWDGLRGDLLVGSTQYYSALVGDFGLPDYSFRVDVVSEEDNSVLLYSAEQGIALYDLALMPEDAEECAKLANYLTVARGELLKEKILTSVAVLPDAEDGKVVVATITVDGAVDMVDKVKAGDGGAKLKWDGLRGDIAQASVGYYSALIGDFGLPDYSFRVDVVSDADRSVVLYSVLNGEAVYDITAE